jgi:sialate O-acetylesterase
MQFNNISKAFIGICLLLQFGFTPTIEAADDWELLISLEGLWKFSIGDDLKRASPDYDDSNWVTIPVPAMWENEGFNGYDGFAWYRKVFNGDYLPKEKPLFLFLGYIDDVDEVYINGQLVGISGSFPPKFSTAHQAFRRYNIPGGILNFDGNNLISVRVYDKYGEGGITHGDVGIYTAEGVPTMTIGLEGVWSFSKGDDAQWKNRYFNDDKWDLVTVPSYWRKTGIRNYDGYGWYRKSIRITADQMKEPMVLLLGKIDDFDQTYFNGKLIGKTNDGRGFGASRSFAKYRIYDIPKELIKPGQTNTIAVRVYDMGADGGIYRGPVGILPKSQVSKYLDYYEQEW